jgi:hypothetical protein
MSLSGAMWRVDMMSDGEEMRASVWMARFLVLYPVSLPRDRGSEPE